MPMPTPALLRWLLMARGAAMSPRIMQLMGRANLFHMNTSAFLVSRESESGWDLYSLTSLRSSKKLILDTELCISAFCRRASSSTSFSIFTVLVEVDPKSTLAPKSSPSFWV